MTIAANESRGDIRRELGTLEFHTEMTNDGILVNSNINFISLNEIFHKRVSKKKFGSITYPLLMSYVANLEMELYYASLNTSELLSNNLNSQLSGKKIDYVIYQSNKSKGELNNFKEFVFDSSTSIRDAVNSNLIDIDKLMPILRKSKDFKKWVVDVDPDVDLAKSYYEEVTKEGAFDKLPGKSVRWIVFTGAGLAADVLATGGIGTAVGLTLGALDTFYLDKLITGWKPNRFVEDVNTLITVYSNP